jgi:hypothetical protein
MDGDLVDEHVVVVLVDDHEVVAEGHEVVAEVEEKARRLFFISLWQDVCVYWLWLMSPIGKKVSKSASCGRWLL